MSKLSRNKREGRYAGKDSVGHMRTGSLHGAHGYCKCPASYTVDLVSDHRYAMALHNLQRAKAKAIYLNVGSVEYDKEKKTLSLGIGVSFAQRVESAIGADLDILASHYKVMPLRQSGEPDDNLRTRIKKHIKNAEKFSLVGGIVGRSAEIIIDDEIEEVPCSGVGCGGKYGEPNYEENKFYCGGSDRCCP